MLVWSLASMSVPVKNRGRYAEALSLAQRAVGLAFDPPSRDARLRHPQFFLGMVLCDSDRMEEALFTYRAALEEYDELGASWLPADTLLLSAEASFLLGRWDDAVTEIETGLRTADEHGTPISVPQSHAYQAVIAIGRGNLAGADRLLGGLEAELQSDPPRYGMSMVAYATAMLAEARGQHASSYGLLLPAWQRDAERVDRYYQRYLAPALVRLAVALDEQEVARQVTSWAEATAALATEVPSVQSAALRCRGMVEHWRSGVDPGHPGRRRRCRLCRVRRRGRDLQGHGGGSGAFRPLVPRPCPGRPWHRHGGRTRTLRAGPGLPGLIWVGQDNLSGERRFGFDQV